MVAVEKNGGPAYSEDDLEFMERGLKSANVPNNFHEIPRFEVLTAISCLLQALDRFT